MKLLLTFFSISICVSAFAQKIENFSGLQEEVEIMIDPFGVPHIFAKNEVIMRDLINLESASVALRAPFGTL